MQLLQYDVFAETILLLGDRFHQNLNDISKKAHKPVPQHRNQREHKRKCDISVTAMHSCSSVSVYIKPWNSALSSRLDVYTQPV